MTLDITALQKAGELGSREKISTGVDDRDDSGRDVIRSGEKVTDAS
jgi:hypothetical protein